MKASRYGHSAIVEKILNHPKTDPNIKDKDGYTALMLAINEERSEVVELLLPYVNPLESSYKEIMDLAQLSHNRVIIKLVQDYRHFHQGAGSYTAQKIVDLFYSIDVNAPDDELIQRFRTYITYGLNDVKINPRLPVLCKIYKKTQHSGT